MFLFSHHIELLDLARRIDPHRAYRNGVEKRLLREAAQGLIDVPGSEEVVEHLERYFAKMDVDSPFDEKQRRFVRSVEAREMSPVGFETAIRTGVAFSTKAAKILGSRLTVAPESPDVAKIREMVDILSDCKRIVTAREAI